MRTKGRRARDRNIEWLCVRNILDLQWGGFAKRISVRFSERSSWDFGRYGIYGIYMHYSRQYRNYRTGRNLTRTFPVREKPRSRPGRASHTNRPKFRPSSRSGRVSHATRPRSGPFAPATGPDLGRWSHHADLRVHFGWCGNSMRSACLDDGTTSFLGKFAWTSPFELCRSSV